MQRLTDQEKQQIREQIFHPVAKFMGTLLFEEEKKFEKKMDAFVKKLSKNTGMTIKHKCEFINNNVKTSVYVRKEESEVMNSDIVIQVR